MKLKAIREIFHRELDKVYPKEEVDSFFYRMIEEYLGADRFVLVLNPDFSVGKNEEAPFFKGLSLLKQEYPIQYILGKAWFMEMDFMVNEKVLIPRPETEELVRWVLEDVQRRQASPEILDLGTGSGCIAVSLAKLVPRARVTGLEISDDALAVARQNAKRHGVDVRWILADMMDATAVKGKWDIVVSNPPYVREKEKAAMGNNVRLYEPATALFVPDTAPLRFYERIAQLASENLREGGALYLEINQYLGPETVALLETKDFSEIELRKDIFGNERMVKAVKVGTAIRA